MKKWNRGSTNQEGDDWWDKCVNRNEHIVNGNTRRTERHRGRTYTWIVSENAQPERKCKHKLRKKKGQQESNIQAKTCKSPSKAACSCYANTNEYYTMS